jgi:hypothetical protein
LGKRKLEAYSDLDDAEEAGKDAIKRIAEGQQGVLELSNNARDVYLRSQDLVTPFGGSATILRTALTWPEVKGNASAVMTSLELYADSGASRSVEFHKAPVLFRSVFGITRDARRARKTYRREAAKPLRLFMTSPAWLR